MRNTSSDSRRAQTRSPLSLEELVRYARHLVLGEVGRDGQERLKATRVLLVGAGGLGSPAGLYLAAAGVGTVGVVDSDRVELSNLQRQILHGDTDLGRTKVDSAREGMLGVNPHVQVRTHAERLTSANALELLAEYDLVIDGSDNFPTRYLVNDAGVLTGTPVVYGAILRWEGQVSLFATPDGPCYRCLFREPPPPGLVPDCAQAGVFGALPGVIGSMQAIEALKWVLGVGDSLAGRLLLFDALAASWREVRVRRNPECPVCGDEPTQTELIDYERFCGLTPESVVAAEIGAEAAGLGDVSAETRGEAVGQGTADASDVSAETRSVAGVPVAGAATDAAAGDALVDAGGDAAFPRTIDARDLAALLEGDDPPLLVDVREEWEWEVGNLEPHGSVHMPLEQVPGRLDELTTERPVVMVCRVGSRSAQAAIWLREAGHPAVANLRGGLVEWAEHVDSELTVA